MGTASSLDPTAALRGLATIHLLAPRTCSLASNSNLCKAQFLGATSFLTMTLPVEVALVQVAEPHQTPVAPCIEQASRKSTASNT